MKKLLLPALITSLACAAHAQADSGRRTQQPSAKASGQVELLNNFEAIKARASLDSGVPEDVVRGAFPNAFPKYGPAAGAAEASNNCDALARHPQVQAEIKKRLADPVEPLNALFDTPESSRPKDLRPYYFHLRDIYERGNPVEQARVKTSWEPNTAVVRDQLKNGISCEISVKVKMDGTVQLNRNYRGRADDGDFRPVIPVNLAFLTVYEVKGVKQAGGETTIQIRGLKRLFE